jgi:hypothetical protein
MKKEALVEMMATSHLTCIYKVLALINHMDESAEERRFTNAYRKGIMKKNRR